jgi:hypothetical protein
MMFIHFRRWVIEMLYKMGYRIGRLTGFYGSKSIQRGIKDGLQQSLGDFDLSDETNWTELIHQPLEEIFRDLETEMMDEVQQHDMANENEPGNLDIFNADMESWREQAEEEAKNRLEELQNQ